MCQDYNLLNKTNQPTYQPTYRQIKAKGFDDFRILKIIFRRFCLNLLSNIGGEFHA